jgi:alkaline phosphatase D
MAAGADATARALTKTYVDGISGEEIYTYHATLDGLSPATAYAYTVSDGSRPEQTFQSGFATAPAGRAAFRFTSYGDLATPTQAPFTTWFESSPNAYYAVDAVESFAPLFHLLNGDLCYANNDPTAQPGVWRDFGNNVQRSAANRPWMPCLGNHEIELTNGPHGYLSYLTRYALPDNGVAGLGGSFYAFQVGSVLFISLDADDVAYQDGGAYTLRPIDTARGESIPAGSGLFNRLYSGPLATGPANTLLAGGNAQTLWLEARLAAARADPTIDWIVVQMHQTALSSSTRGNGSDLGIRQAWLPLFDRYQVDLVLCGHEHDYERSFPVRGFDHDEGAYLSGGRRVDTLRPRPALQDAAVASFDTSQGTVHLILGGGGTNAPTNGYGAPVDGAVVSGTAKVISRTERKSLANRGRSEADAYETAVWSARTDTSDAYGLAVFDVDPGNSPGGPTSITLRYYHTPAGASAYALLETITLTRRRSDGLSSGAPTRGYAAAGPALECPRGAAVGRGLAGAANATQATRVPYRVA